MSIRKPIFEAVKVARGRGFDAAEVILLDEFLDGFGVPRDVTGRALANVPAFFAAVRASLFNDRMSSAQVDGCDAIIRAAGKAGWNASWTAYALATAIHETNATMQPVREAYWMSEGWRKSNLRYWPWYGRGYVQLTWERNYQRADDELCLDGALLKDPDLAMRPDIAAAIMVCGMEEGWFAADNTGAHKLGRHLPREVENNAAFASARRIINGVDRAGKVAAYALNFQSALIAGRWEGSAQ